MSKNNDDLFGGFFDFNGDGKTSIDEGWIAYNILEDINKTDNEVQHRSSPKPDRSENKEPAKPFSEKDQPSATPAAPEYAQYKKKKIIIILFIFSVVAILLILFLMLNQNTVRVKSIYKKAENRISLADYYEAEVYLDQIKSSGYKDTDSLIRLCEAHKYYECGNMEFAYFSLQNVEFLYQDAEQMSAIEQFKMTLEAEYNNYITQIAREHEGEYHGENAGRVPYVGKSETDINLSARTFCQ